MRKTYFLIALLFAFGAITAQEQLSKEEKERREKNVQAGNPFAKYGSKAPVATLSKGKYLEVHDLDSIVTIGTTRWHVDKEEIVGNIVRDTLNPDAQPIGDIAGHWMSPDPLTEEFPDISPYAYANNNPIRFTDPTGLAPEDCCGGLVSAIKGVYGSVKSEVVGTYDFVTSDAYKSSTWKGAGNLLLGSMAMSGPAGNIGNAYVLDAKFGTNSVGAVQGMNASMESFGNDLISGDTQRTAGALTTAALIFAPSKLDDVAKLGKVSKIGEIIKVSKMSEFFSKTSFGEALSTVSNKTKMTYQGQSIYSLSKKVEGLRKGDVYYLDNLHKDHIEIFNSQGNFREVRNLDGSMNQAKTNVGLEQGRTIKIK